MRTEAAALIRNTGKQQHTVVAPQKAYDATKVAAFKKFCTDFFDEGAVPSDPTELARFGKDKLAAKRDELNALVSSSRYPFVGQLSGVVTLLDQVVGKPIDWYLSDFDKADELIEAKEDLVDPIKSFLNGQQAKIFDEAQALLSGNTGNLGYLPAGSADPVKTLLADTNAFRGNKMNQLKAAADTLRGQIDDVVSDKRADVTAAIEGRKAEVLASAYYANATSDAQESVIRRIDQILARLVGETQVALILQVGATFEQDDYPELLSHLVASQQGGGNGATAAEADGVGQDDPRLGRLRSPRIRSRRRQLPRRPAHRTRRDPQRRKANHALMETAPLKSFATSARTELIREVGARITAVLAQGSPERVEQPKAVTALERAIAGAGGGDKGKAHVADKVAYTWFNRIIALRFMDANGYTGIGVVSPAADQVGQPEVLAAAKRGQVDTDVVKGTNPATITGLLNGTRQPRPGVDAQAEAYALLLADYCRFWNAAMPFMFEREGDYTELLIPANLLADDSVLSRSVTVLTEDVCQDVEVIGWLYQFYISERKDEVFAGFKKNKKAGADEIPAATQLFTPHWIVRYLVENSLGRLWMLNRPSSGLASQMDYYIAPVDEETDFLKISKPEELKVIDPACGSGHMLTYAFDLLYAIYEEEGYAPSEIPGLILANNLYGTEIDPRAGALAAFALTMKAAARRKLFLKKPGRAEHLRARPDLLQRRRAELPRDQGRGPPRGGGVLEPVRRGRHLRLADPA